MFEIIEQKNNDLDCTIIKNSGTGEYVSVVPEFGVNVNDLVLKKGEKLISILDGNQYKNQFIGKNIFKGAKLFPFVNRIENGSYYFDGNRYQLDINYPEEGNAAHGTFYNIQFRLINRILDSSCARALFKLEYDGSISGFPFAFDLELIYMMDTKKGFSCETIVTNTGLTAFPFNDGWHPFFSLNKKVDHLLLKIPNVKIVEVDEKVIPSGCTKSFNWLKDFSPIGKASLDNCFHIESNEDRHKTEIYDIEKDIKIIMWQEGGDGGYNFLQIYIPPDRMSIAVEPMTGNINNFNNKDGLRILKPGKSFNSRYGVNIE